MSFDEFTQREIENFAQDYRMDKDKINSKDRTILHYIAHSRHPDQKGNKNPYRGIWDDELRLEINKELIRIRDTYKLRMYETEKKKSHKLICDLLVDNEQLKDKNNFTFTEHAIKDMKILLDKCNTSSKDFDKEDFISFVKGFVINLAKIDNELEIHRNIYNSLVEKKWIHVLPGSDKIIEDLLPDCSTLLKERNMTYDYWTEFVLCRIISKEVERKGWMPDTSHFVNKNEIYTHIAEHLKKELPVNNNPFS